MLSRVPLGAPTKKQAEEMFGRKASPDTELTPREFLKKHPLIPKSVTNKVSAVKNKVVDKVSDAMSYPARRNAQKAMLKADQDVKDIKLNREAKGVEPEKNDYTSELFRARTNVAGMKLDAQKSALKQLAKK